MAELLPPEKIKEKGKAKYARRVCERYLGVPKSACERVFDVLYEAMKETFKALA